ncbi:hypothetical protein PR048_015673 [Dryococelus australis]|uniref:Uncharacterized protein n=1 Tax=Dryococelus australis TaxID=614101 RepID=A0ABQ9HHL8_9NEOP|nr:hypothetical protein PR048_015673 [Dryococelus australis]
MLKQEIGFVVYLPDAEQTDRDTALSLTALTTQGDCLPAENYKISWPRGLARRPGPCRATLQRQGSEMQTNFSHYGSEAPQIVSANKVFPRFGRAGPNFCSSHHSPARWSMVETCSLPLTLLNPIPTSQLIQNYYAFLPTTPPHLYPPLTYLNTIINTKCLSVRYRTPACPLLHTCLPATAHLSVRYCTPVCPLLHTYLSAIAHCLSGKDAASDRLQDLNSWKDVGVPMPSRNRARQGVVMYQIRTHEEILRSKCQLHDFSSTAKSSSGLSRVWENVADIAEEPKDFFRFSISSPSPEHQRFSTLTLYNPTNSRDASSLPFSCYKFADVSCPCCCSYSRGGCVDFALKVGATIVYIPNASARRVVVEHARAVPPGDVGGWVRYLAHHAAQLDGAARLVVLLRDGVSSLVHHLHPWNCNTTHRRHTPSRAANFSICITYKEYLIHAQYTLGPGTGDKGAVSGSDHPHIVLRHFRPPNWFASFPFANLGAVIPTYRITALLLDGGVHDAESTVVESPVTSPSAFEPLPSDQLHTPKDLPTVDSASWTPPSSNSAVMRYVGITAPGRSSIANYLVAKLGGNPTGSKHNFTNSEPVLRCVRSDMQVAIDWWRHGGAVVLTIASHYGDPDTIPGEFTPGFSQVGIRLDDAACRAPFHLISGDDGHLRFPAWKPVTRRVLPRPAYTPHSRILFSLSLSLFSLSLSLSGGIPGSIPGGVAPRISHVGIVPVDATDRRVFLGITRFLRPYAPRIALISYQDFDSQALQAGLKRPETRESTQASFTFPISYLPASASAVISPGYPELSKEAIILLLWSLKRPSPVPKSRLPYQEYIYPSVVGNYRETLSSAVVAGVEPGPRASGPHSSRP